MTKKKLTSKRLKQIKQSKKKALKKPAARKGFFASLKEFLAQRKQRAATKKKTAKKPKGKTVKVRKASGLSLLMSKYASFVRKGAMRKPAAARAAAPSATKRTKASQKQEEIEEDIEIDESEEASMFDTADDELDLDLLDLDEAEEAKPKGKQGKKGSRKKAKAQAQPEIELDEEQFIEIPESLLAEAEELQEISKTISSKDIEEAAEFLGVFEGGGNLDRLAEYAGEDIEDIPDIPVDEDVAPAPEPKKDAKEKKAEPPKDQSKEDRKKAREDAKKQREAERAKQLQDRAAAKEERHQRRDKKREERRKLAEERAKEVKTLFDRMGAISKLPIFDSQKIKKLLRIAEKSDQLEKVAAQIDAKDDTKQPEASEQADATPAGEQPEVAEQQEAAADQASEPPAVGQPEDGAPAAGGGSTGIGIRAITSGKAQKQEGPEAGDPTEMDLSGDIEAPIEKKQVDALGVELLDDDQPMTAEEMALREEARLQMEGDDQEEAPEPKKEKRGLFGFGRKKPPKETEAQIRKNMGINMESVAQKDHKKVDKTALEGEMSQEDFLESTVQTDTPEDELKRAAEAGAKLSPRERRAMERDRKKQEKEEQRRQAEIAKKQKNEEKQWAEEAKKREKLLKQKEAERKKLEKQLEKQGGKMKIKIPKKKKKQSGLKAFMNSLNYMGMGKEKVAFIDNLGTMMDAGLPLLDALRALQMENKNKQMKKLLTRVLTAVELGNPLWRAMEAQYFFSPQQISMVHVGEDAGNLVENLRYLSIQEEKDRSLKSKVKTAMIYPIIVFVMLTLIIMGLGMFVLPNLIQVIISLGVPLPFITRMIVAFTNLFTEHGATMIPTFFGCVILFAILNKYTNLKIVTQWVMFKIPGIGVLIREATLSRFGVVLGGLLQAGVQVTDALESLANVTPIIRYKKFYYQLLEHIKLGDSFTTSFKKIKLTQKCFPGSMQQLIITGEKSGSLTKIMMKIAEIHDKKASEVAEKLPVILEPMLLLFIGGLVGTIALGILAPIYSVVGNVGGA